MKYERIHEEAFAIERVQFKKTDKRVSPKKTDPFIHLPGTLPILVSAPHSVRHVRRGEIKVSDESTGSLAYLLNRETGCHTLAVRKLYGGDPSWDESCIFKERLRQIVAENRITFVLDLHGAKRSSPFDVELGCMNGRSLLGDDQAVEILRHGFEVNGIDRITKDEHFTADHQHTVTKFCAEVLHIPAMQLEINHRYRAPNKNGEDFRKMFTALAQIIVSLSTCRAHKGSEQ